MDKAVCKVETGPSAIRLKVPSLHMVHRYNRNCNVITFGAQWSLHGLRCWVRIWHIIVLGNWGRKLLQPTKKLDQSPFYDTVLSCLKKGCSSLAAADTATLWTSSVICYIPRRTWRGVWGSARTVLPEVISTAGMSLQRPACPCLRLLE